MLVLLGVGLAARVPRRTGTARITGTGPARILLSRLVAGLRLPARLGRLSWLGLVTVLGLVAWVRPAPGLRPAVRWPARRAGRRLVLRIRRRTRAGRGLVALAGAGRDLADVLRAPARGCEASGLALSLRPARLVGPAGLV
ncbi:MAG TPA: hypothetical protein VFM54_20835, partial [Micromonosporaceae bacterium]|nr:hypothetical protein [Micromonosporaceae bacterium]